MLHFFGEFLVAVTGEIRNWLLVLGLVVAVINIQQFQYPESETGSLYFDL